MQITRPNAVMVRVKPPCFILGFPFLVSLAFLGGHHVDIARYKGHFLAPAFGALQFQRFMLGDGLRAFKLLPAFPRNGIGKSAWAQTQQMSGGRREYTIYGWWLIWGRCPAEAVLSSTGLTTSSALRCLRMRSYCATKTGLVGFGVWSYRAGSQTIRRVGSRRLQSHPRRSTSNATFR